MARQRKSDRQRGSPKAQTGPLVTPPAPPASVAASAPPRATRSRRALGLVAGLAAMALLAGIAVLAWPLLWKPNGLPREAQPAGLPAATPALAYVGAAACARCHASEHDAWQASQHARAMAPATTATVRGGFAEARFTHAGVTSTFFRRDGQYFVRTDGPDGRLADFEIRYTFGVEPLQQYLIELPGGRLQALGIAWDARPVTQGGQRWFHLYPDQRPKAGDALHWTGIDQNWNYQCADCHSTNLRKNYDPASRTYASTWTDVNVACEACHGPGSQHVAWAGQPPAQRRAGDTGLTVQLDERRGVRWSVDPASGQPARSQPRATAREIETCARCHARRGQFSDAWHPGQPFGDGFRAALIEPGLYHPDGQQRDEVFVHGSFLASRMNAHGVTCSDCHDPHGGKTRLPGNAVCAQCHAADRYDTAAHHRHRNASAGAQCAACHMPTTTYMGVDPRRDHSLRIPRPDRSLTLGVPNACTGCHLDRKPEWAVAALARWVPKPQPGFQSFAEAFALADRGGPGAVPALLAVFDDRGLGPFVRASALARLGRAIGPRTLPALRAGLTDADALVRAAAASALQAGPPGVDPRGLVSMLAPALGDPVRSVRMAAARALAGRLETALAEADRPRFARALDEYIAAERFNADRPEALTNLGSLFAAQRRSAEAEAAFRAAIALDDQFVPAALGLAELQRMLGREREVDATLRAALVRQPDAADAYHALGLSLVRQQRRAEALVALAEAARRAPDNPRYAYVHAVALNDAGQREPARRTLEAALKRRPDDRELAFTLALFERDAGRHERALARARRLVASDPDDAEARQLADQLGAAAR